MNHPHKGPGKRAIRYFMSSKAAPTPKPVKILLLLFIAAFGLLGIRLFPTTFAEGWLPTASLLAALGLISVALFEVVRTR
jgi:hypothetical protein